MRLHAIIHAPFETPGAIAKWVKDKNFTISETPIYETEILPELPEFDILVIMGGPQSTTQLDKYPYLATEIKYIQQAIKKNMPVLGICLGAQLIATALGASTQTSEFKEVGSYPVHLTKEGMEDPVFKHFDPEFNTFHWHNEMPGLAADCVLLAYSKGCSHQAFRYKDRVYGLQFHLEMTSELIKGMIEHGEADLAPGKFIRTKEEMVLADCSLMNEKMYKLLNHLEKLVEK